MDEKDMAEEFGKMIVEFLSNYEKNNSQEMTRVVEAVIRNILLVEGIIFSFEKFGPFSPGFVEDLNASINGYASYMVSVYFSSLGITEDEAKKGFVDARTFMENTKRILNDKAANHMVA